METAIVTNGTFKTGPVTKEIAFSDCLIPVKTRTYYPVSNQELFELVETTVRNMGLSLENPRFGLGQNGMLFFGSAEIVGKDIIDNTIRMMVGVRTGHNGTRSAQACFGSKVLVCSNGAFHWTTDDNTGFGGVIRKRHSSDVYEVFSQKLHTAFEVLDEYTAAQSDFFNRLMDISVSDDVAAGTVIDAVRTDALNITKVMKVVDQWRLQGIEPENEQIAVENGWHKEFMPRNAFTLFNMFTEVNKENEEKNPVFANSQTLTLTKYFRNRFLS